MSLRPPPGKEYKLVLISIGDQFIKETSQSIYTPTKTNDTPVPLECYFYVDWENRYYKTLVYNALSGRSMVSKAGAWRVLSSSYSHGKNGFWRIDSTEHDNFANVEDKFPTKFENHGGDICLAMKKYYDKDYKAAMRRTALPPPKGTVSHIAVQTETSLDWIVKNITQSDSTNILKETKEVTMVHEVVREKFIDLSTELKFETSIKTETAATPVSPSLEASARFESQLNARETWTETVTTSTKTTFKSSIGTVVLSPMTAKALEKTTWYYYLDDNVLLMIEEDVTEITVDIDSHGDRVYS